MAEVRRRSLRRATTAGLVFLTALTLHTGLLYLAETTFSHDLEPLGADPDIATPVDLFPPVRLAPPPKPKRAPPSRKPPAPLLHLQAITSAPTVADIPEAVAVSEPQTGGGALSALAPSGLPADLGDGSGAQASAAPARTYPINPGYWQVVEHWLFLDRTERYCIRPENIETFMAAPCNHIYHCAYPVQTVGDGVFHFEGTVSRPGERYDVRGGGSFTPTRLHLSAFGAGHYHIVPFIFSGSLDGQFLSPDCPAGAKTIRQNR